MTYEQYCNMTWAEFQIRLFAFNRIEKRKDIRTREIAYYSYIGGLSGSFGKVKFPTKKQFWDLGIDKPKANISKQALEIFKQQQQEYNNRKNGK